MSTRRGPAAVLVTLVLALGAGLAAACSGDGTVETRSTSTTPTTSASVTTGGGSTGGPVPTVAPTAKGVDLELAFLRGEKVGIGHRRVAPTQAVGRAAMEQLLAGPSDTDRSGNLTSAIPTGTRLRSLDIADRIATVDLSGEFVSGGGSLSMRARLAQVVFTLTQFPTVDAVKFRIDGTPTTVFGGEGVILPSPAGRGEFADVTPLILVESVAPGDTISSPVTVAGINKTFESTVRIRVLGAGRRVLADTFTTGQGGVGSYGPFRAKVEFDRGGDTSGVVVVWEDSPRDGSMINVVEIPVRLS